MSNPLNQILTEQELLELLGVKKSSLSDLRIKQKLPFCQLSRTNRVYLSEDVVEFIKSKRIILDKDL